MLRSFRRDGAHCCPSLGTFLRAFSDAGDGKSPLATGADDGGASPAHVLAPPHPPIDQQVQLHGTTSKTGRQAGQRWGDRAAGRRSADKHFVVVSYYCHYS